MTTNVVRKNRTVCLHNTFPFFRIITTAEISRHLVLSLHTTILHTTMRLIFLFTITIHLQLPTTNAWSLLPWTRQEMERTAASTMVASALLFGGPALPAGATDANMVSTTPGITSLEEKIQSGLAPATEDRPQISLNPKDAANSLLREENRFMVQGLVYLYNSQSERPLFTDTLVLTVTNQADKVLAGAKIPVSKLRFPLSFRMSESNVVNGQLNAWEKATREDDILIIKAAICPEASEKLPCSTSQQTFTGLGVSKLIPNLPGLNLEQSMGGIRAAASIPISSASAISTSN
jgi:hypothetical protein